MSEEEYYPWDIVYRQAQITWLLSPVTWTAVRLRQWPFSIRDDIMTRANTNHHAAFELISLIKAELEARLDSIGRDKYILLARFYNEYSEAEIAHAFNLDVDSVGRRISRGMRYISGRRKRANYGLWIRNGWREKRDEE